MMIIMIMINHVFISPVGTIICVIFLELKSIFLVFTGDRPCDQYYKGHVPPSSWGKRSKLCRDAGGTYALRVGVISPSGTRKYMNMISCNAENPEDIFLLQQTGSNSFDKITYTNANTFPCSLLDLLTTVQNISETFSCGFLFFVYFETSVKTVIITGQKL